MIELNRIQRQILRALLKKEKATFWELINFQDRHLIDFLSSLKDLLKRGILSYEKPYFKIRDLQSIPEVFPYKDPGCLFCNPFSQSPFWQEIFLKFKEVTQDRPLPTSDFDQGFVRPEDTIKRVAFIYLRGDLENTEIFILGDDDLLSLAMALTKFPKKIVVVEIDKRINNFIEKVARQIGYLNLEVYNYNVLEEIPAFLRGRFDVFITDPVETKKGLKLFVARCIAALKGPGSVGYIGFTHREASLKKWRDFESFLMESGFVITDILRDFTTYPEKENSWEDFYRTYRIMKEFDLELPNVDWYKSSFLRFEVVEGPYIPKIDPPENLEELYFDEEAWATPLPSYLEKW